MPFWLHNSTLTLYAYRLSSLERLIVSCLFLISVASIWFYWSYLPSQHLLAEQQQTIQLLEQQSHTANHTLVKAEQDLAALPASLREDYKLRTSATLRKEKRNIDQLLSLFSTYNLACHNITMGTKNKQRRLVSCSLIGMYDDTKRCLTALPNHFVLQLRLFTVTRLHDGTVNVVMKA